MLTLVFLFVFYTHHFYSFSVWKKKHDANNHEYWIYHIYNLLDLSSLIQTKNSSPLMAVIALTKELQVFFIKKKKNHFKYKCWQLSVKITWICLFSFHKILGYPTQMALQNQFRYTVKRAPYLKAKIEDNKQISYHCSDMIFTINHQLVHYIRRMNANLPPWLFNT